MAETLPLHTHFLDVALVVLVVHGRGQHAGPVPVSDLGDVLPERRIAALVTFPQ